MLAKAPFNLNPLQAAGLCLVPSSAWALHSRSPQPGRNSHGQLYWGALSCLHHLEQWDVALGINPPLLQMWPHSCPDLQGLHTFAFPEHPSPEEQSCGSQESSGLSGLLGCPRGSDTEGAVASGGLSPAIRRAGAWFHAEQPQEEQGRRLLDVFEATWARSKSFSLRSRATHPAKAPAAGTCWS